jgi:hypothetical protein
MVLLGFNAPPVTQGKLFKQKLLWIENLFVLERASMVYALEIQSCDTSCSSFHIHLPWFSAEHLADIIQGSVGDSSSSFRVLPVNFHGQIGRKCKFSRFTFRHNSWKGSTYQELFPCHLIALPYTIPQATIMGWYLELVLLVSKSSVAEKSSSARSILVPQPIWNRRQISNSMNVSWTYHHKMRQTPTGLILCPSDVTLFPLWAHASNDVQASTAHDLFGGWKKQADVRGWYCSGWKATLFWTVRTNINEAAETIVPHTPSSYEKEKGVEKEARKYLRIRPHAWPEDRRPTSYSSIDLYLFLFYQDRRSYHSHTAMKRLGLRLALDCFVAIGLAVGQCHLLTGLSQYSHQEPREWHDPEPQNVCPIGVFI